MSSAEIAVINLYLQAGYVFLTLVLAGAAIWSILRASRQSRDALAASERQSKEAIAAVNKQIEASERQAREATYNQHKPVIVPVGGLEDIIDRSASKPYVKWGQFHQEIDGLRNIGIGPAFNIYGILFGPPYISKPIP